FGLKKAKPEAARERQKALEERMAVRAEALEPMERYLAARLQLCACAAALLEGEGWRERAERMESLMAFLNELHGFRDHTVQLQRRYTALMSLVNALEDNEVDEAFQRALRKYIKYCSEEVSWFWQAAEAVDYPLARGEEGSLRKTLLPRRPAPSDLEAVATASGQVLECLNQVMARAMAHVMKAAEEVEAALDLPPLAEVKETDTADETPEPTLVD
ncbi:MAG: hypothetical protein ACYTGH_14940, partial [Planctomycetota bacterium]